jgi:hypothetical protein
MHPPSLARGLPIFGEASKAAVPFGILSWLPKLEPVVWNNP